VDKLIDNRNHTVLLQLLCDLVDVIFITLHAKLSDCCSVGLHEFLQSLDRSDSDSFPSVSMIDGAQLPVCGETLEQSDLETLLNYHWLNDKVI